MNKKNKSCAALLDNIKVEGDHSCITKATLEVLPEWLNSIWKNDIEDLLISYCGNMDKYVGDPEKWGRYCRYEDGREIPHGIRVFRNYEHADWFVDNYHFPFVTSICEAMLFYVKNMIETIQNGEMTHAAKYAGALSHLIGDSTTPSHLDNAGGLDVYCESIRMLFPPPEKLKGISIHAALESPYREFSIKPYRPKLLGSTPETAAFALAQKLGHAYVESKGQIAKILKGVYEADEELEFEGKTTAGAAGSRCLADAYYTIFSLACGKTGKNSKEISLSGVYPQTMTAFAPFPYSTISFDTINCNWQTATGRTRKKKIPLCLKIDSKNKKTFKKGLGFGAPFILEYYLQKNTFNHFKALVGPSATLGIEHKINVKVSTEKKTLFKATLKPGDDLALPIDIKLNGAEKLRIEFSGPGKGIGGDHLVLANPRISI